MNKQVPMCQKNPTSHLSRDLDISTVYIKIIRIINIFIKRHKVVTSEALTTVNCVSVS